MEIGKLTFRQKRLIPFLLSCRTIEEACKGARVGRGTIFRWLREPFFQAELNRQRETIIAEALAKLKGTVGLAVDRLAELLSVEDDALRLRACQTSLDFFLRVRQAVEFEARLERLEATLIEGKDLRH